ncbi:MAG: Type 1 glutamine amidotransferase-like domain-containing protein [Clostridiales bacterium]|nr:Type 1 glutamine amidotransferase-like domain-containing protein [Clostridiales bacterium]
MKILYAIGGGEISELETYKIDKAIVASTGKKAPKVLFIPTASGEPEGYVDSFNKLYGEKLGCKTDVLRLLEGNTSPLEAEKKILSSDIIYVGGGNTRMMMKVWQEYGIDIILKKAHEDGIILSGMSAGSICWFSKGQSDTEEFERGSLDNYTTVDGIGIFDAMHCPHYNEDTRDVDFDERIKSFDGIGIAIDNNCAIEIRSNTFKIHKADSKANAYKIYYKNEVVHKVVLDNEEEYLSLEELMKL